jgi:hypothetical protein
MQITVTRKEIEETHQLLALLCKWESLTKISDDYNRGQVNLSIEGNGGKVNVGISTDGYGRRASPPKTTIDKCEREIQELTAQVATKLAGDVVNIIHKHMPLPIE